MSALLCFRILRHLEEIGLLKKGDVVLDPMAGTGMTNICAGAMDYPSISVELEDKFVGFQQQNKEYVERHLYKDLDWQMIQGDSRSLSQLLGERGLKSVTSPPYLDALNPDHTKALEMRCLEIAKEKGISPDKVSHLDYTKDLKSITSPPYSEAQSGGGIAKKGYQGSKHSPTDLIGECSYMPETHGQSEGQIGNLKDKPLKSITSPPYSESTHHTDDPKELEKYRPGRTGRVSGTAGDSVGNIGHLPDSPLKSITSPPYADNQEKGGGIDWEKAGRPDRLKDSENRHNVDGLNPSGYGQADGQIGKLKDTPLKSITSPPYADAEKRDRSKEQSNEKEKDYSRGDHNISAGYQGSEGNIGNLPDKVLKSIMSPPYEECRPQSSWEKQEAWRSEFKGRAKAEHNASDGQISREQGESYLEGCSKFIEKRLRFRMY
jgi:hypothetical protein